MSCNVDHLTTLSIDPDEKIWIWELSVIENVSQGCGLHWPVVQQCWNKLRSAVYKSTSIIVMTTPIALIRDYKTYAPPASLATFDIYVYNLDICNLYRMDSPSHIGPSIDDLCSRWRDTSKFQLFARKTVQNLYIMTYTDNLGQYGLLHRSSCIKWKINY